MPRDLMSILFVVSLFALLATGLPIGAVLILLSGVGILLSANIDVMSAVGTAFVTQFTSWSLTALPLFVLMGEVLARTGAAARIFAAMAVLCGRLPGGMLQVNMMTAGLFAALSGFSTATVATIGKLGFNELHQRGYKAELALGSIAGASTLGILIPPSVALVLYGFTFDVSIADLFLAGVLPGLMLLVMFAIYAALRHRATARDVAVPESDRTLSKGRALLDLLPFLTLIVAVFGSIYGGIATPTESAVIGVFGGLIIGAIHGNISVSTVVGALRATAIFSGAIGFVLGASSALQVAMAFSGIPREIVSWVQDAGLSPNMLLLVLALVLMVMGCFIDGLSMIVLTGAVLLPVVKAAGIDLLWFGIYMVVLVEIGLITPPIGFNLFVLQRITGRGILNISRGAFPFVLMMLIALVIITVIPSIVTFLPRL